MSENPFVWGRPLDDPADIVGMDAFARRVASALAGRTNVVLFGPRGAGKTSFVTKLAETLAAMDPPRLTIRVDLQRAVSVQAVVSCVRASLESLADRRVRRKAAALSRNLDASIGVNLAGVSAQLRRAPSSPASDEDQLHTLLRGLAKLAEDVVLVFDEVQQLVEVDGGAPLATIRSALLGPETPNVSLMFTGSYRRALQLLVTDAAEPLFNQATHLELPPIPADEFGDFLDLRFSATGIAVSADAVDHLLGLTVCHPRRTQQLAWQVWENLAHAGKHDGGVEDVEEALDMLLEGPLLGDTPDPQESRREYGVLLMLAEQGSKGMTSPGTLRRYGIGQTKTLYQILDDLDERAVAHRVGEQWRILDPLLAEWLRRSSPFRVGG